MTPNGLLGLEQVDPDLKSFVKAFEAIYVFQPLAIQVRLIRLFVKSKFQP